MGGSKVGGGGAGGRVKKGLKKKKKKRKKCPSDYKLFLVFGSDGDTECIWTFLDGYSCQCKALIAESIILNQSVGLLGKISRAKFRLRCQGMLNPMVPGLNLVRLFQLDNAFSLSLLPILSIMNWEKPRTICVGKTLCTVVQIFSWHKLV